MKQSSFFGGKIHYSACNEDARSECEAFNVTGGERVCCILGGGERFFNMLADERVASSYTLVDANPEQARLFELKKEAYRRLSFEEFGHLIGLKACPSAERVSLYQRKLRPHLSAESQTHWDGRLRILGKGVLYQGGFEKFVGVLSRFLTPLFGKTFRRYFECDTLEEQRRFFQSSISGLRWKLATAILCRKIWFRVLSRVPAFFA